MSGAIGSGVSQIVGSVISGYVESRGYKKAGAAMREGAQLSRREYEEGYKRMMERLQPYMDQGGDALQRYRDLIGLGEAGAQEKAYAALERSPLFADMARQGEEAILQNAAATGGLRGGNIQGALLQYRPQMLNQQVQQQMQALYGLGNLGYNAVGQANNAEQFRVGGTSQSFMDEGSARAFADLGIASAVSRANKGIANAVSNMFQPGSAPQGQQPSSIGGGADGGQMGGGFGAFGGGGMYNSGQSTELMQASQTRPYLNY